MAGISDGTEGRHAWMLRAACRSMDPDIFFPGDSTGVDAAIAICRSCPVARDCLDYAIRGRISHGIWGGLSERARVRLARRNRAAVFSSGQAV